jgi:hypothetical protein
MHHDAFTERNNGLKRASTSRPLSILGLVASQRRRNCEFFIKEFTGIFCKPSSPDTADRTEYRTL